MSKAKRELSEAVYPTRAGVLVSEFDYLHEREEFTPRVRGCWAVLEHMLKLRERLPHACGGVGLVLDVLGYIHTFTPRVRGCWGYKNGLPHEEPANV